MPDNPVITTEDIQKTYDYNEAVAASNISLSSLNDTLGNASSAMSSLKTVLDNAGLSLQSTNNLIGNSSAQFGLITTAIIGARESFKSFMGVDTTRLTTFSSQFDDLYKTLTQQGTVLGLSSEAVVKTVNMLKSLGKTSDEINAVLNRGVKALAEYAKNVLISADNGLRLQNSMLQLSARAGNLQDLYAGSGEVFRGVGEDLDHLNDVLERQSKVMSDAMQATGIIDPEVMYQYAAAIGSLPGGFKALAEGTTLMDQKTNILNETIQYAVGSGREYADVIQDMKKVILDYGVSLDEALQFTARITDISNQFHVQIEDVRDGLLNSADAFKMFTVEGTGAANMTQSMAEVMAEYVGSLRDVGVPAKNAIELFKTMTSAVSGLRVEQKAFLSAQTGGPGGLMGAFQIDKMLKEGNLKGVYDKVQQQMRQMFGRIITVDEAANSPQAALQMERQIQLLRQGPLGQFARTDVEAERLLESLQKGSGPVQKNAQDILKDGQKNLSDVIQKGNKWQELSYTKLTDIDNSLNRMRLSANVANLTTVEDTLSARAGGTRGAVNPDQSELRALKSASADNSGSQSSALAAVGRLIETTPESLKSSADTFKQIIGSGVIQESVNQADARLRQTTQDAIQGATVQPQSFTPLGSEFVPSGKQVARAIPSGNTNMDNSSPSNTPTISSRTANNAPLPVTIVGSTLQVQLNGICPHCGRDFSEHATSTNPASTATSTNR